MAAISNLRAYARRAEPEDSIWHMGALMTFLADGADTGGRFGMMQFEVGRGAEPPPHTHSREDEAFIITDGAFHFSVGDQRFEATPGSFVFLPRGLPHGFAVQSEVGKGLTIYTPAGLEEAFRELGEPALSLTLPPPPSGPPPADVLDRMLAVFRAKGVEFLPPPGA